MKRYCYLISPGWGDRVIPQHFRALGKYLAVRGHRVVFLVDRHRLETEDYSGNPAAYLWPSRRPVTFRDAWFFFKQVRRHRPDCIIANFASTNIMMLVGWVTRVPCRIDWYHTVTSAMDMNGELPRWKAFLLRARKRLVYGLATHIVPVSRCAQEDVQRVFGVPSRKTTVFYNSLADPLQNLATPIPSEEKRHRLICVGRFVYSKGQDVVIRAMALLRKALPQIQVEFIGDGPLQISCMALAAQLGVESTCVFSGELCHGDVLKRMHGAVATVVPTRAEAFGLVAVESMAVGTPVIASRVGGIPEIIRDGVDGFLIPAEDFHALADKVEILVTKPALAMAMRRGARSGFISRFEREQAVSEQARWLEEIVGQVTGDCSATEAVSYREEQA